jgi:hypothetical protein
MAPLAAALAKIRKHALDGRPDDNDFLDQGALLRVHRRPRLRRPGPGDLLDSARNELPEY